MRLDLGTSKIPFLANFVPLFSNFFTVFRYFPGENKVKGALGGMTS